MLGFFTYNVSNDTWLCSTEIERLLGIDYNYPRTRASWFELIHPDDRAVMADYLEKAQSFDYCYRIIHATDDTEHWMQMTGQFQSINNGSSMHLLGSIQSLDELSEIESDQALLNHAVNASTDAIFLIDESLHFHYVNDAACHSLGYSREELLNLTPADIDPDVTHSAAMEMMNSTLSGSAVAFESRHKTKEGHVFPVELTASLIQHKGKKYSLTVVRNISERKQLEQEANHREQMFRTLAENSPDIILRYDRSFNRVYANPATCELFGKPLAEIIGRSPINSAVLTSDQNDKLINGLKQAFATAEPVNITLYYLDPNGISHEDNMLLIPECNSDGDVVTVLSLTRDITSLRKAEHLVSRFLENFSGFVYSFHMKADKQYSFPFASPGIERLLGLNPDDVKNDITPLIKMVHPDDVKRVARAFLKASRSMSLLHVDFRITNKDGCERWMEITSSPESAKEGEILRHGILLDITDRKQAEQNMRLAASVFTNAQEGILVTNPDNIIIDINESFTRITGYKRKDVIGKDPSILSSGYQEGEFYTKLWVSLQTKGHWSGEVWNRRKNGEVYAELLTISAVKDEQGQLSHYIGMFADITALKRYQKQLEQIAHYDVLTAIPNRFLLADRLQQAIAHTNRSKTIMAVCYLDLDGFKEVNDQYGHAAGDQLLIEIAGRMQHCLRGDDTVARIGGDEFALLLLDLTETDECKAALERILAAISQPVILADKVANVTASIGVTMFPNDDDVPDILLRHADQAMYIAKNSGKNNYNFFDFEAELQLEI